MTTTDTPAATERGEFTHAEWADEARARFGENGLDWAFVCPRCGDVATAREFPGPVRERIGQECIGRHRAELPELPAGRGCDWAAYGLIPGPVAITMSDGRVIRVFRFAPAPIAPADVVRGVVGACVDCGGHVSVHGNDGLAVGYITDLGVRCGRCCGTAPEPEPPQAALSAPCNPGGTPGPESATDAPDAAVGAACGLSVERRDPGSRTPLSGDRLLDLENWDYRVALTQAQAVLGYREARPDVPVTILFADTASGPTDWCHELAPDMGAAKEHIEQYRLPVTENQLVHAVLLVVEACAEDTATRADAESEA